RDLLRRHLRADAGVDQDVVIVRAYEQRPHRKRDAILLVRRRTLFPQRLGHDAEHRAAVETEAAVGKGDEIEGTETHGESALNFELRTSNFEVRQLFYLHQYPFRAARMDKRDPRAVRALAR